jgi:zinc protease
MRVRCVELLPIVGPPESFFDGRVLFMIQDVWSVSRQALAVASFMLALGFSAQAQSPARAPAISPSPATTATPSADQIINRYVEASGGREAWQKLTSRVSTGTIEVPSMNLTGTVEIYEKAPDRMLAVITIAGASFRQAYDGTSGWTDDPSNGLREQSGAELAEARRDADFYHSLDLRKLYAGFKVSGKAKVGDRDAYLVEGTLPEGGKPDKMYFDSQSGLPVRIISEHHGPDGVADYQEDFEDFRDVDGIKLPFTIHQTNSGTEMIIKIEETHHNVEVEDSRFSKPPPE